MMGFNAILKTKRVYMLYLLPFILAAIAFLRFTFGPEDFSVCLDLGVISIPDFQEQGGLRSAIPFLRWDLAGCIS